MSTLMPVWGPQRPRADTPVLTRLSLPPCCSWGSGSKPEAPLPRRRPALTVADPVACRVLGSEQLELGLQGPPLPSGAVQPLERLHEHFEEE